MARWAAKFSPKAEEQYSRLPKDQKPLISRAVDRLCENPFAGDVDALEGASMARLVADSSVWVSTILKPEGDGARFV